MCDVVVVVVETGLSVVEYEGPAYVVSSQSVTVVVGISPAAIATVARQMPTTGVATSVRKECIKREQVLVAAY